MTSWIRNRTYQLLKDNEFIEKNIQKGFWSNLSGSIEHTELMTHLINNAKRHQRSLVISLIDLKNAFGEVNHEMLRFALQYHHIPPLVIRCIMEFYKDFRIHVATDKFITNSISIERGVLQGESFSPLLFNLCMDTLINTMKIKKLNVLVMSTIHHLHHVTGSNLLTIRQFQHHQ